MREFFERLEEAKALIRLELATADDPEAIRTLKFAIYEIEEVIKLARSEAARTPWGEGRAASL
jgi:hypothetical protein